MTEYKPPKPTLNLYSSSAFLIQLAIKFYSTFLKFISSFHLALKTQCINNTTLRRLEINMETTGPETLTLCYFLRLRSPDVRKVKNQSFLSYSFPHHLELKWRHRKMCCVYIWKGTQESGVSVIFLKWSTSYLGVYLWKLTELYS